MKKINKDNMVGYPYSVIRVTFYAKYSNKIVAYSEFDTKEQAANWILKTRELWATDRRYYSKIKKHNRISWNNKKIEYATKQKDNLINNQE